MADAGKANAFSGAFYQQGKHHSPLHCLPLPLPSEEEGWWEGGHNPCPSVPQTPPDCFGVWLPRSVTEATNHRGGRSGWMASEVLYNMNGSRGAKSWVLRGGGEGGTPRVPILLLRDRGKGRKRPGAVQAGEAEEGKQGKRKWRRKMQREKKTVKEKEGGKERQEKEIKTSKGGEQREGKREGRERREKERKSSNREERQVGRKGERAGATQHSWALGGEVGARAAWRGARQAGPGSEESTVGRYEDLLGPAVPLSSEGIKNKLLRAST